MADGDERVNKEEGDSSRGPRKFVLCGGVGSNRSVVGQPREYAKSQTQKNTPLENDSLRSPTPLGSLLLRHTNPSHSRASLYLDSGSTLATHLLSIEILSNQEIVLELAHPLELKPIVPLTPESLKSSTPEPNEIINLYLRCDSCHSRHPYTLQKLDSTTPCKNCGKTLNVYHWTGRCGKPNTTSIIDITSEFTRKYLTTAGFIMRKFNLWVHDARGIMCYVDFRGRQIPSIYAFSDGGGVSHDKLPSKLIKVRRELIPYLERPTSADISQRCSRQTQVLSTTLAPDPLELQATINELTEKGVNVLEILSNLNKNYIIESESKDLNNENDINKPKCPSCSSPNFSIVKNQMGTAERCVDCDYLKITGDEIDDERRGSGTKRGSDKTRTQGTDDSFF